MNTLVNYITNLLINSHKYSYGDLRATIFDDNENVLTRYYLEHYENVTAQCINYGEKEVVNAITPILEVEDWSQIDTTEHIRNWAMQDYILAVVANIAVTNYLSNK